MYLTLHLISISTQLNLKTIDSFERLLSGVSSICILTTKQMFAYSATINRRNSDDDTNKQPMTRAQSTPSEENPKLLACWSGTPVCSVQWFAAAAPVAATATLHDYAGQLYTVAFPYASRAT